MSERFRHWCFTVNNYTEDDFAGLSGLEPKYKYIVCGKEVGESGTPHLQGFVSFANPIKATTLHRWFNNRGHWLVARNPLAAATYCKKEGNFVEFGIPPAEKHKGQGKRCDLEALRDAINEGETDRKKLRQAFPRAYAKFPNFVSQLIIDQMPAPQLQEHPLRDWQQELTKILRGPPDSRSIIFVVDLNGNSGKSWFCDYYELAYGRSMCLIPGKKADMVYALMSQLEKDTKVYFIDAPRSKQGEYIQYDFLEELKNGKLFNTKYESRMIRIPHPHVVVMMNQYPDYDKLSSDRYLVIEATNK